MKYLPILEELFESDVIIFMLIGLVVAVIIGNAAKKVKFGLSMAVTLGIYFVCEMLLNITANFLVELVSLFVGTLSFGAFVGFLLTFLVKKAGREILLLIFPIIALILEILPNGVVLNFGNPEGEPWSHTYSYFSLTPFGYANFGPFLTALFTCVLVVLAVLFCLKHSKGLLKVIKVIALIALLTSLMPLMFGMNYVTGIGFVISVLIAGEVGMSFVVKKS